MTQQLILSIGVPGSGKSSFLDKYKDRDDITYVCPDDLRTQIAGDANDQTENDKVWSMAEFSVEKALKEGQSVILDSTLTDPKIRSQYISLGKDLGAEVIGIIFDVPLEVAKERNSERDRRVPNDIIEIMHTKLMDNPPTPSEGFSRLFMVDESGEVTKEIKLETKEPKVS